MIKHFCDNCGTTLTDEGIFRITVEQYPLTGSVTPLHHFEELCPMCTENVARIIRGWKKDPRENSVEENPVESIPGSPSLPGVEAYVHPGSIRGRLVVLEFSLPHRVVVIADDYSSGSVEHGYEYEFAQEFDDVAVVYNTTNLRILHNGRSLTIMDPVIYDPGHAHQQAYSGVIDLMEATAIADPLRNTAFSAPSWSRDRSLGGHKVWIVPFPYDYCRMAEFLIRADTPEEAWAMAHKVVASDQLDHPIFGGGPFVGPSEAEKIWAKVSLAKVKEWTSLYYFNGGCDQ